MRLKVVSSRVLDSATNFTPPNKVSHHRYRQEGSVEVVGPMDTVGAVARQLGREVLVVPIDTRTGYYPMVELIEAMMTYEGHVVGVTHQQGEPSLVHLDAEAGERVSEHVTTMVKHLGTEGVRLSWPFLGRQHVRFCHVADFMPPWVHPLDQVEEE